MRTGSIRNQPAPECDCVHNAPRFHDILRRLHLEE